MCYKLLLRAERVQKKFMWLLSIKYRLKLMYEYQCKLNLVICLNHTIILVLNVIQKNYFYYLAVNLIQLSLVST